MVTSSCRTDEGRYFTHHAMTSSMGGAALLTDLSNRAGDALRWIGLLRRDRISVLMTRDEIATATVRDHLQTEVASQSAVPPETAADLQSRIQVTGDYIDLEFPMGSQDQLIARLDRDGIHKLPGIVEDCLPHQVEELALRGDRKTGKTRCPECGSTNYHVRSDRPGRPRETEARFSCLYCGTDFDTPVVAENRQDVSESD